MSNSSNSVNRPNVLYVFADQMRGMDMACAGNAQVHTPNLDRLAARGLAMRRAYANTPVCTASRAMLLTGLYPAANRVVANDLPLPTDLTGLGHLFRDAGYRTGYIGKWHLDGVPRDHWTPPGPRRQGFEEWAAYNCSHDYYRAEKYYRDLPAPIRIDGYEPVVQTNLALDFLATADERPFCLLLSWGPPHDPYAMVPPEFADLYDPESISLRPNVQPVHPDAARLARDWDPATTLAQYYAAITALDHELGRLLDFLQASGQAEHTIVIFTSDHGDMLWSQGRMKKQQPWEESIHIPFLVRWPGRIAAGNRSDALFGIIDHLPTLLAVCGLDVPGHLHGRDFAAHWQGDAAPAVESLFLMDMARMDESDWQNLGEWRGVRTPRYTYARTVHEQAGMPTSQPWLLYDNDADPYQLVNLVDDPDHADLRRRLDAQVDEWQAVAGDPGLPGFTLMRQLGLTELWNERERLQHPHAPQLIV